MSSSPITCCDDKTTLFNGSPNNRTLHRNTNPYSFKKVHIVFTREISSTASSRHRREHLLDYRVSPTNYAIEATQPNCKVIILNLSCGLYPVPGSDVVGRRAVVFPARTRGAMCAEEPPVGTGKIATSHKN